MTTATVIDTEQTLLESAKAGDRQAFGELVRRYQKRAYLIAYGFVRNREDAMDVAQESFVKAYRAIHRFDSGMPFYPWLYRIVRNTSFNRIKRKQRRGETSLDQLREVGQEFTSPGDVADRGAILNELRGAIGEAMNRVSDEHREILTLRHIHELSYQEIAACLEIPKGTVMSRLHGARKRLKIALEELNARGDEAHATGFTE